MPLVQLIYVSSAVRELSDAELDKILESSVRHNTPQAITGMLLYASGNFMQVLEGEVAAISETYQRICKDPLHHQIYLLAKEVITEREFSKWNMGFHRLTQADAEANPAFAPLFINGFDPQVLGPDSGLATGMLKKFSKI